MTETLKRLEEKFGLHAPRPVGRPVTGPGGCLALVIDRRCVVDDLCDLRLAISFGDNPFPPERGQGVLCPPPMAGKRCFLIPVIATVGPYLRLLDRCHDGREASDTLTVDAAQSRAREILAAIPDADYSRTLRTGPGRDLKRVVAVDPLPLEEYRFLFDAEPTPVP